MFEKKIFKVAVFHDGKFKFCPEKAHSHTSTITLVAKNGLDVFSLDNIIPCSADTIEAFIQEFQSECKSANIELISIEIYFADIDLSFFHVY